MRDIESDYDMGRWIAVLHHEAMRYFSERMDEYGLPHMAIPLLLRLREGPAPSQDVLCSVAARDKANISRLLDTLEERGVVVREPDPEDSRVKRVRATDEGRALVPVIEDCLAQWNEMLTRGLTPEERSQGLALLQRMAENCGHDMPCERRS